MPEEQRHVALFFLSGRSGGPIFPEERHNLKDMGDNSILVVKFSGTSSSLSPYGRSHVEETGHTKEI